MRVSISGFTSAQRNFSSANKKGIISFSNLLPYILADSGHEVGYDLKDADLNIVFVLDITSLNAAHVIQSLEILRTKPSIIAFDDWNIKGFYKNIDKFIFDGKFSKSHPHTNYDDLMDYQKELFLIAEGEFKSIFPAYKTGEHSLLGIRGDSLAIDPSIYTPLPDRVHEMSSELLPVHASLASKDSWFNSKKYTILNVRNESEKKVLEYYCKHRMVLTPPHYHDSSGWYRNRYTLANFARALIIEDEFSVFGDTYKIKRDDVTSSNINSLFELQNRAYNKTIMSIKEVKDNLRKVIV